jgi:hypothetical protein
MQCASERAKQRLLIVPQNACWGGCNLPCYGILAQSCACRIPHDTVIRVRVEKLTPRDNSTGVTIQRGQGNYRGAPTIARSFSCLP